MMPILSLISIFLLIFHFESGSHGAQGSPDDLELLSFHLSSAGIININHYTQFYEVLEIEPEHPTYYEVTPPTELLPQPGPQQKSFTPQLTCFAYHFLFLKDSARLVDLL